MTGLILLRHGESEWNAEGLLTGWADPDLTSRGCAQARAAGRLIAAAGLRVDVAHTSMLTRAQHTAKLVLQASGNPGVELQAHWRLNERHVGTLEGLDKAAIIQRWGNEQRRRWRDDPAAEPPALDADDPRHPKHQTSYRHLEAAILPASERLTDLTARVLAEWHHSVITDLRAGLVVMVVAHQGPLRAIRAHLEGADADEHRRRDVALAHPIAYITDPLRPCHPRRVLRWPMCDSRPARLDRPVRR